MITGRLSFSTEVLYQNQKYIYYSAFVDKAIRTLFKTNNE